MKPKPPAWLLVLSGLLLALLPSAAFPDVLPVIQQWKGTVQDVALLKEQPAKGYITDAETFAQLWKAWAGDRKLPAIDFAKEIVLVGASNKLSYVGIIPLLDEKGNLEITAGVKPRPKEAKGFEYVIATVSKAGVKTIGERAEGPSEPKLIQKWSGEVADTGLLKKKPEGGVITDTMAFEQLWKAWGVKGDLPRVDFDKEFVLVFAEQRRPLDVMLVLSDKGDLTAQVSIVAALKAKGFGYLIGTVSREGVKSCNGAALDKK